MEQIYVLKCKNNKYYVGKTSDIDRRFSEHLNGECGSEWTKLYRPCEIIEHENVTSDFDEMKKTLEYMKNFGIDNVRGAQWSNINLTSIQRDTIRQAMNTDRCYNCGEAGHFSSNCTARNQSIRISQTVRCFSCGNYGHYANNCNFNHKTMRCDRCGRDSHLEDNCYATFDIDGRQLDCARCGRSSHNVNECYATNDIDGQRIN
ncbi:unnamed protein product [Rotaria magnacalcarata]|uniref:Uncharacterized protein n=1 Tax=Rotaria magnacalcarata TaxID=392030 RepID=A0A815W616_9BILA|nr:unnamed protein product [Rotaria magnacalcarata]CAF1540827.1 unnamed protein product [Rotaria magnacalcarata]CAF2098708.1 unnamed protein product [Rotaria magnacalcarata]CAF2103634.1 unnamed protein product [Rotaria magnacalcarata]CAF3821660.1 unnamed protein product [Rotaria magnacalcarata]